MKFAAARILLVKTAAVKTNSVVCVLETWQQNVANCLRVACSSIATGGIFFVTLTPLFFKSTANNRNNNATH